MTSPTDTRLIPVLRRPRREWQIPPLETAASRQERQATEARAKAFAQGTTPYGREIFRRLLDLAWRRVAEQKGTWEATREVCEEIAIFPELHSEFVLMLGRTLPEDPETLGLEGTTPWAWAALLVGRAVLAQKLNAERAAEAHSDSSPGTAEA
jgi:hypothetical protein